MNIETGFPIDFSQVCKELMPEVTIDGVPVVMVLRDGKPDKVQVENRCILKSGIIEGGRLILREGNNLAPHTPSACQDAMCQRAGSYSWAA